jgi:RNA polymerase sigma-70 factor (sigma-E family)
MARCSQLLHPGTHRVGGVVDLFQRFEALACIQRRQEIAMESTAAGEFGQFVEAELPRLLGLARALTGNDHDAWDLTQECLIRVGIRWSRIDLDRNPSGDAKTCLIRLNLNRTRQLGREWLTPDPPADPRVETSEAGATTLDAWLERAIISLPPRQRATLVLRYLEDLSIPDIADLLGCSEPTVRSQLSRGLRVLSQSAPDAARP